LAEVTLGDIKLHVTSYLEKQKDTMLCVSSTSWS